MAEAAFGPAFEIHGGGLDLVFPHHENELAQSRALGHDFAKVWMHNGMLEFSGEKMSKSLGNDVSLRNVLDTWGREVVLLFFMTAHWRKPIDFTDETLEQAKAQVQSFKNAFRLPETDEDVPGWDEFTGALDDDFNTPGALSLLHLWRSAGRIDLLEQGLAVFGLETLAVQTDAPIAVIELAQERELARRQKRFEDADRLRQRIHDAGWIVRDDPEGFQLVPL
jgi:cysteinyl-tRNA synthetase